MKVSLGHLKRKKVFFQPDETLRPTKVRIRQAIMNTLRHRFCVNFSRSNVLDAFAGSGALSFEAASLGAPSLTLIEKDPRHAVLLQKTVRQLGLEERTQLIVGDVCDSAHLPSRVLQQGAPYDLVFLDPPYFQGLLPLVLERLLEEHLLSPLSVVVVECHKSELEDLTSGLTPQWSLRQCRCYGKIAISYLQLEALGKDPGMEDN